MKEHAELHLLLSMVTPVGWLERVPTFKEKRELVKENDLQVSYGLLGYPVLQTADIIIYRANLVPVGRDQAAHLEISREIARRFNRLVGEDLFPEPEALISDVTGELPGVDGRKMSKCLRQRHLSFRRRPKRRRRPSTRRSRRRPRSTSPTPASPKAAPPAACAASTTRTVTKRSGTSAPAGLRGCGQSKKELAEIINTALAPFRARRAELEADPGYVGQVLADGAERARAAASETMTLVRRALKL